MIAPFIFSWIVEPQKIIGRQEHRTDICALVLIAVKARIGKVFWFIATTMFDADYVVNFKSNKRLGLVQKAIFTKKRGTEGYK